MAGRGAADAPAAGPAAGGSAGGGGVRHHAGAGGRGHHEHAGSGKQAAEGARSVINLTARAGGSARRPWRTSQAGTADGLSSCEERQARSAEEDVPAQHRVRAVPGERSADGRGQGLGSAQGLNSPGQDKVSLAPRPSYIKRLM